MVEEPNWVRSPVRGWHQWRAANSRRRAWSSPRGGGAASNGPTTLKRSRAHCWWERIIGVLLGVGWDIGWLGFHFLLRVLAMSWFYHPAGAAASGKLCGPNSCLT